MECRVSVEERDDGLPDLRFELVSKRPGVFRAAFDPPEPAAGEQQRLLIYGLHPSLKRYLGPAPDFAGQDRPEWKAILAEVVTEAVARRIVSKKYPPSRELADADSVYYDHFTYAARLLPIMQRLVPKVAD